MASSGRVTGSQMGTLSDEAALEAARDFLRSWLDVVPCKSPPIQLYGFDPENERLYRVKRDGPFAAIGKSMYLAVSIRTGVVRIAGTAGE